MDDKQRRTTYQGRSQGRNIRLEQVDMGRKRLHVRRDRAEDPIKGFEAGREEGNVDDGPAGNRCGPVKLGRRGIVALVSAHLKE